MPWKNPIFKQWLSMLPHFLKWFLLLKIGSGWIPLMYSRHWWSDRIHFGKRFSHSSWFSGEMTLFPFFSFLVQRLIPENTLFFNARPASPSVPVKNYRFMPIASFIRQTIPDLVWHFFPVRFLPFFFLNWCFLSLEKPIIQVLFSFLIAFPIPLQK